MEEHAQTLNFSILNNYNINRKPNKSGGFGLSNLKKRLDLYYPDKYTLETSKNKATFSADLKFMLS